MPKRRPKATNEMIRIRNQSIGKLCPITECDTIMGDPSLNNCASATIEHIHPLDDGGVNAMTNIAIICGGCQRARNETKQHFKNEGEKVPYEYWQVSLVSTLPKIIEAFYAVYHEIFLTKRGLNSH